MNRRVRIVRSAAVPAMAGALALAGCATAGTHTANASAQPKPGGTLVFAVGSDAGCIDPQQVGSNDSIYSLRQIVDSLTDQNPTTGEIVPWLASSWEISPDATTFTFHLRPGATFSDGTPVNAQAVKDNFDAVPKLGALAGLATGYLSGYVGTEVVDELTARVTFQQPNAQFLQASSTFSLGLVSSASTRKTPQERCTSGVAGSGPFTIETYERNQQIVLAKRSGYNWGSSLFTKEGEAYLDKIVFKVIPEAGVRSGSLASGQVDAIGSVGRADETALRAAGINLQARANPGVVFSLGLNNSRPLLQDVNVRQAIRYAVNRKEIAETVFPSQTQGATSILAHTTPGHVDHSGELAYDPGKAKSLLDSSGWTVGSDGVRTKNGQRLSLSVIWFANAATNQPSLELVQQYLADVGIEITLKELPIAQVVAAQAAGDFDAAWGNLTRADPDILRSQYSTKLANYYRIPVSELDTVLTEQAATADPAKRAELVERAQRLIITNAYVIPVVELQTELGVSPKVHDLAFEASSRIQLHDTWKE